jgi:AcrR family transcriptional regulator
MNGGPSLRARRAARTREALLRAAAREIGRRGYAAASVDGIAVAAGVTKGAFYTHFPDKAGVLHEVVACWTRERSRRIASARTFGDAVVALGDIPRGPAGAPLTAELWRCSMRDAPIHRALSSASGCWAAALERLAATDPSLQVSPRDAALAALALHDGAVASACVGQPPDGAALLSLVQALRTPGAMRRTA